MSNNGTNSALFEGFDFSGIDFSGVDGLDLGDLDGEVSAEEHDAALQEASLDDTLNDLGVDIEKIFEEEEMAKKTASKSSTGKAPVGRPRKTVAKGAEETTEGNKTTKELTAEQKTPAAGISSSSQEAFVASEVIEAVDRLVSDVTQIRRELSAVRLQGKDSCEAAQEAREYVKACHEGLNVLLSAVTARADVQEQLLRDVLVLIHNDGRDPVGSRPQDEILNGISSGVMAVQETLDGLKGTLGQLAGMQTLVQENGGIVPSTTTFKAPSLGSQTVSQVQHGVTGSIGGSVRIGIEGISESDIAIVAKMVKRQTRRSPLGGFATALSGHLRKQSRNISPDQVSRAITALGLVDSEGFVDPSLA